MSARGFTLLEIVLYMGLVSFVTTTLATTSWQLERAARDADARAALLQQELLGSAHANRTLHYER